MSGYRDDERRPRHSFVEEDEMDDDLDEGKERKAPLFLRMVVWVSVIILLFAAGYWGTSLTLRFLDSRKVIVQENVTGSPTEAGRIAEDNSSGLQGRRSGFEIFIPRGNSLVPQSITQVSGLLEDDAKTVISDLLDTMRAENTISEQVRVLHVFRNGDLIYLDLNDLFASALQKLPASGANLVMTAIVRTIVHNFSPATKVRFLINGKDPDMKTPVDLTMPWQLKTS